MYFTQKNGTRTVRAYRSTRLSSTYAVGIVSVYFENCSIMSSILFPLIPFSSSFHRHTSKEMWNRNLYTTIFPSPIKHAESTPFSAFLSRISTIPKRSTGSSILRFRQIPCVVHNQSHMPLFTLLSCWTIPVSENSNCLEKYEFRWKICAGTLD